MRQIQSFRCFSSVLLLSSKKYSVYYSTKNNIMFKHCSTVPLNVLLKYSHFERAKQQAQLWASDAGDIFMYSCVIQHHLSTWWFQNWCLATWKYKIKSLATTETAASIDYWFKLQQCKSETDDSGTTNYSIGPVLTGNIQRTLFAVCQCIFMWFIII